MIFVIGLLAAYSLVISVFYLKWRSIPAYSFDGSGESQSRAFSVIIPFRDEAHNLEFLVRSFERLNYPTEKVEFIFVNDHSQDEGLTVLRSFNHPCTQVISLVDCSGKKPAIESGINHARNEWIITTDADCVVPENWLRIFDEVYRKTGADMCLGSVRLGTEGSPILTAFQQMEQLALTGIGGALAAMGHPVMCNGANLSYTKTVFREVGGFKGNEHLPSGDDQFLLKKIRNAGGNISFIRGFDHTVLTSPQQSWKLFMDQRRRWAGKWKATGGILAALAVLVGLSAIAFPAAWVGLLWYPSFWPWVLGVTVFKLGIEFLLVRSVGRDLQVKTNWWRWSAFEICYPLYAFWIIIRSNTGQYEWKGRHYSTG